MALPAVAEARPGPELGQELEPAPLAVVQPGLEPVVALPAAAAAEPWPEPPEAVLLEAAAPPWLEPEPVLPVVAAVSALWLEPGPAWAWPRLRASSAG